MLAQAAHKGGAVFVQAFDTGNLAKPDGNRLDPPLHGGAGHPEAARHRFVRSAFDHRDQHPDRLGNGIPILFWLWFA